MFVLDVRGIICAATHDEIWLSIYLEKLAKVIITLVRCGIRVDSDALAVFI
jgi:hypothetical protein